MGVDDVRLLLQPDGLLGLVGAFRGRHAGVAAADARLRGHRLTFRPVSPSRLSRSQSRLAGRVGDPDRAGLSSPAEKAVAERRTQVIPPRAVGSPAAGKDFGPVLGPAAMNPGRDGGDRLRLLPPEWDRYGKKVLSFAARPRRPSRRLPPPGHNPATTRATSKGVPATLLASSFCTVVKRGEQTGESRRRPAASRPPGCPASSYPIR